MSFVMPNTISNGATRDARPVQANFTAITSALQNDYLRGDGSVAATTTITASATPTADAHLVNKAYADALIPAGVITAYGGAAAPSGWALCLGQAVSIADNPDLHNAISNLYGSDTGTQFFLPDLQSRFPVGKGTADWSNALNETGGDADAVVVEHNHGSGTISAESDGTHDHDNQLLMEGKADGWTVQTTGSDDGGNRSGDANHTISDDGAHTHSTTGSTADEGVTGVEANLPPYITLNYIIRLG